VLQVCVSVDLLASKNKTSIAQRTLRVATFDVSLAAARDAVFVFLFRSCDSAIAANVGESDSEVEA
jgi:hypothetical protein